MIVKSSELPKMRKISIQQCVGWTVKLVPGAKYFVQHNRPSFRMKRENVIATDFQELQKLLAINEIEK
jgi:hypothetical protein